MDVITFDRLARILALAGTRRAALGTLLAGTGAALGLGNGQRVSAQPTCTPNDEFCLTGAECCSGKCSRKRKRCRPAEGQGICTIEQNVCGNSGSPACGTSSSGNCVCVVTKKGHSFCSDFNNVAARSCDCTSNRQCERRFRTKGAKCFQLDFCGDCPNTNTACVLPCPDLFSA